MTINTGYAHKSVKILEKSYTLLLSAPKNSIEYEIYRNSTIKCFEVVFEQIGELLKRKLKSYFASPKEVEQLNYKDVFRHAFKHNLLDEQMLRRWFAYRDNRKNTAHHYGESFAEETVVLLKNFIKDAETILEALQK